MLFWGIQKHDNTNHENRVFVADVLFACKYPFLRKHFCWSISCGFHCTAVTCQRQYIDYAKSILLLWQIIVSSEGVNFVSFYENSIEKHIL